ncbi:cytosolic carboxypeptidase-like protein 5 [Neocloeon triangulifer]|uniref:cytosolic carboxypeptidase-like protein 5 n=1 Tax=Neocloeon triangulifer TaxID=2078957 RepID=UPI00286F368D|nr:cytosolic carboxypeptidase-like protein 5 [Neocloeon triangulifer]
MEVECEGFTFTSKFDSGNLDRVEFVPKNRPENHNGKTNSASEHQDFEFNLWTKPDCGHTEFENGNRTWFYFGIKGGPPFSLVKLNIMNMNRQHKMFSEGMAPVFKVVPGRNHWERIHDKPAFTTEQKKFTLSFKFRTLENQNATTYFAFTYPFSYTDIQNHLKHIDTKSQPYKQQYEQSKDPNTIYYHRECVVRSTEHRRVDLLTVTSYDGISDELEPRLRYLFPETNVPRPHKFPNKKVVFVSARVHPGETQSSFVLNGMLNYLLQPTDPVAQLLRKQFVFKFIPTLNPDGVANGHYRTDMRGVNLNRVYLNPSLILHPTIFAARSLIRYHHYGCEMPEEDNIPWDSNLYTTSESSSPDLLPCGSNSAVCQEESDGSFSDGSPNPKQRLLASKNDDAAKFDEDTRSSEGFLNAKRLSEMNIVDENSCSIVSVDDITKCSVMKNKIIIQQSNRTEVASFENVLLTERSKKQEELTQEPAESGIFMYLDLHGHASKKGVFMYGNHFENIEDSIETFLMPKLMSLNSLHFHFTSCNFSKRNMYLRDKRDGMSREGSGRVAVFKMTGLVRCYTLECNYNTGRIVNTLPSSGKDNGKSPAAPVVPPKYNPPLFEEVGKSMAVSILDLTGSNPLSRIRHSEFRALSGVKDWLRRYIQTDLSMPRIQRKTSFQVTTTTGLSSCVVSSAGPSSLPPLVDACSSAASQSTARSGRRIKTHLTPLVNKPGSKSAVIVVDLKENLASSSQNADSVMKLKNPMSPKENILQAPSFSKSKLGQEASAGRVSKTRKDKPSSSPPEAKLIKKLEKTDTSAKSVQVLKQGSKRLRISSVKQEVHLENTFQVLATKPDTLWDSPTTSKASGWRPFVEQQPLKKQQSSESGKEAPTGAKGKQVRTPKTAQLRGPHLSPIKKGNLTRKKSFEWEKKKNKMLIKNKKLTISSEESLENAPLPENF